jgi:hypothetical protein
VKQYREIINQNDCLAGTIWHECALECPQCGAMFEEWGDSITDEDGDEHYLCIACSGKEKSSVQ